MVRSRTNLWLSPRSKQIFKSRAALEGVTLEKFVDRVANSLEKKTELRDKPKKIKGSGFDII